MNLRKAREVLTKMVGDYDGLKEMTEYGCFGDCCLTKQEKKALVTVISEVLKTGEEA